MKVINRHLVILVFCLFSFCLFVAGSQAATYTANSCSRASIAAAIASASSGDTVNVPSGNCTWDTLGYPGGACGNPNSATNSLCINKNISLIGAGIGSTVITAGSGVTGFLIVYNPSNQADTNLFRVSGFTFDQNGIGKE